MLLTGFFLSFSQASIARENTGKISSAFDKTITGRVTDGSNGAGLAGASVAVKGSSSSALTDGMGNYSISVPNEKAVLVVSFVGFVSQEVIVGTRTSVDFALQSVSTDLTQVVVVGYGTQSKRDVTRYRF
jgi:iron complex outermembrane receptor protein